MKRYAAFVVLLVLTGNLRADKLILWSGKTIEGTVRGTPGSADVIIQTPQGQQMTIRRDEIKEGTVTFQGPRACLTERNGKETCEHLVEAISKSNITIIDDSTGQRLVQPWNNYVSASFKNLAPNQLSSRLVPTGMQVEISGKEANSRGIVTMSEARSLVIEKPNRLKEKVQLESINRLLVQNPLMTSPSWIGYGLIVPGLKQIRSSETRVRGIALLGSSIFCAGLAGWSQMQATRARSPSSNALPIGGNLVVFGNGNASKFNRARNINYLALTGLGAVYLANAFDLAHSPSRSVAVSQPGIQIAWSMSY